ncbi:MAG: hypothetical protein Q4F57_06515 [Weeksellaceae bacterium]|nr:hypothetical protein [Weeksellaceae bacterium]
MKLLGIGSRIEHPEFGKGVVTNLTDKHYWVTFIDKGLETIEIDAEFEVVESCRDEVDTISLFEMESSLVQILRKWNGIGEVVSIGDKWKGGKMILEPGDAGLQSKEVPIDTFFHKIVMVRDRLRVMEQKINASGLSDAEKVDLQQYITRIYGSLTTFNVLFKIKEHHFSGQKGG